MPVDAGSRQSDLVDDDEVTSDEEEEDFELGGVQEVAEQEDLPIEREYQAQVAALPITTTSLLLIMVCSIVKCLGNIPGICIELGPTFFHHLPSGPAVRLSASHIINQLHVSSVVRFLQRVASDMVFCAVSGGR